MAEERVQKILARAGYGSRRASEELISAGRVRINGIMAELGSKADPQRDTITVDNQPIARAQAPVYIALNKPRGILSEVSPEEERETVRDLVAVPGHMFIVGRLDMESEGLILLTNDGELANRLTHPRYGHEKEYRVLVGTRPDEEQLGNWRRGIVLEDGHRTAPAEVRLEGISGKNAWLRVILHEGRKRQIREMGRLTGLPVLRIVRIRIGSLVLGEMKPGEWRELRPDEVRALRAPAMRQPQARVTRRRGGPAGRQRTALGEGRTGREERPERPQRRPREGLLKTENAPRDPAARRPVRGAAKDRIEISYPRRSSARPGFEEGERTSDRSRPSRPAGGRPPAGGRSEEGRSPDYGSRGKPSRPAGPRRSSTGRGSEEDRPAYTNRTGPAGSRPARRPARPEGASPRGGSSGPSSQRPGGSGSRPPRGGATRRVTRKRNP